MRVAMGLVVLGLAACNGEDGGEQTFPPPTVAIVAPADGAELTGTTVDVEVEVTDFAFEAPESAASLPVLPLWGRLLLTEAAAHEVGQEPAGFVQIRLDGAEVDEVDGTSATLSDVAPGEHTLEVELLWPDGDSFYPPVTDAVVFTVAGE